MGTYGLNPIDDGVKREGPAKEPQQLTAAIPIASRCPGCHVVNGHLHDCGVRMDVDAMHAARLPGLPPGMW